MEIDASLAEKALGKQAVRQCLSCMKLADDEDPPTEWEPAIRTIRIDLPSTKRMIHGKEKMECAAAISEGEVCGTCFQAIHEAPKGVNPGI